MLLPTGMVENNNSEEDGHYVNELMGNDEDGADPLAANFDKHSMLNESFNDQFNQANLLEIESRKAKDSFFDSLGGWNADDKFSKLQAKKEKKERKREEKEAR